MFDIDGALDQIALDENLMGMSVVVMCGTEPTAVYHHGLKDYTRNLTVDDSTMYRIASVSKTITATGMLKLIDQGTVNLDDDISDILGYEVRNPLHSGIPITVEMVMSHRSSLQDGNGYNGFLSATYNFGDVPPSLAELIVPGGAHFTSNMFRTEMPGTFFAYSNVNYGLLATLIEAASGQRFDVFMREEILLPLGIAGSYNVQDIANIDNVAVLYRNQGGWTPQADNYQGTYPEPLDLSNYSPGSNGVLFAPQGGLRVSALDLAKLMQFHMQGGQWEGEQIISSASMELMREPLYTYDGTNGDNYYGLFRSWGLGIQRVTDTPEGDVVFPNANHSLFGHPGEAYGLISDWYFDPEDHVGVIFMTNGAWNGFSFGEYSAFYTLEEQVFQAVEEYLNSSCAQSTLDQEGEAPLLHPNPADDTLKVTPSNRQPFWKRWFIRDAQGRLLESKAVTPGVKGFEISVAGLPAGVYLLELRGTHQHHVIRWVKS